MGDLISRSALIEELHHMIEWDVELKQDYEYLGIDDCIRSMPTAYDIEKVVAELVQFGLNSMDKQIYDSDTYYDGVSVAIRKACNIVRKGGVE